MPEPKIPSEAPIKTAVTRKVGDLFKRGEAIDKAEDAALAPAAPEKTVEENRMDIKKKAGPYFR